MNKPQEERFEVRCNRAEKIRIETEDSDNTIYVAKYTRGTRKDNNYVEVVIKSSQPLKAMVGEDVDFVKKCPQKTIMDSVHEKDKADEAKKKDAEASKKVEPGKRQPVNPAPKKK